MTTTVPPGSAGPAGPVDPTDPPDLSDPSDPSDPSEPRGSGADDRSPGELGARELLRWAWRQLTSMRTALVLLLLLALAAVPGSVVPQEGVDSLKTSQWQDDHPRLTPVYERLGLFDVYDAPWFSAIYLLLMVSLVGCIVPRTLVYARALRAAPPRAPRNLTRLPDHASYTTSETPEEVVARARAVLRGRRYRVRAADDSDALAVSSERGYLREAGNLLFHLSVLVVLVGFAVGGLLGYKGGVLLLVGNGFSNSLTQYDDFVPGDLFSAEGMEPFCFTVDDFDVEWLESGPRQGMSQGFSADMRYREDCVGSETSAEQRYDLRVNHPLAIGDTEVFLIGHGYAPVITVRDGEGEVAYTGPTIFLPTDQSLFSFGVVKAPFARPGQVGLEGVLYPTFINIDGNPVNVMGEARNPLVSLQVWTGDLGLGDGEPQSVYVLDKADAEQVMDGDKPLRLDLTPGETAQLPDGLGSVTFEGVEQWNRLQISQTPGKEVALAGVVLALVGLLGSLFIRPRRVWVRARLVQGETLVEVAALDRTGGGDVTAEIEEVAAALRGEAAAGAPSGSTSSTGSTRSSSTSTREDQ